MNAVLSDATIVDLSHVLAGPYCAMMLGDLGATVIKVERPGQGDDTREFGPPSAGPAPFVEQLRVDTGMHAFARLPEREHQLFFSIARNPDCTLALAPMPEGAIVGQVTLAPLDTWWSQLENAYEIAIEVSEHWRGLGIARRLLAFALELDTVEDLILCALGLSLHWDIEGLLSTPIATEKCLFTCSLLRD